MFETTSAPVDTSTRVLRDKRSETQLLQTLVLISLVAGVGALVVTVYAGYAWQTLASILVFLGFIVGSYILLRRGITIAAQIILPSIIFMVISYSVWIGYGLHDINLIAFAAVITIASLTLGQRGSIIFTSLIVMFLFIVGISELQGYIVNPASNLTEWISPFYISILVVTFAAVQGTLINRLNRSLTEAQINEREQIKANQELRILQEQLESRVTDRTMALEAANQQIQHRANLFQAVAQVARAITSFHEVEGLLPGIAGVISDRFGYYHVGIFLLDESNEYAVLSASNSEGGRKMLGRGHRLKVGQTGIVGYVTSSGTPRIALDTGKDAVFFENPDLPETRSELALPLNIGNKIIGALDVQSTQPNAFSEDDITILTTLADQVAIAIQNAQSFRETQRALAESQTLFGNYVSQAWRSTSTPDKKPGYRFAGTLLHPLERPYHTPEIEAALEKGEVVTRDPTNENDKAILVVPIKLRGEAIGVISVSLPRGDQLDEDNTDIIRAASERIALALENSTLLEESQRRAAKERTIGEISSKIGGLVNIENIIQTAIQELGATLPDTEIAIQFEKENEPK